MTDIRDRPGSPQRSAGLGYQRITDALAAGRCVMLDGGVATELPGAGLDEPGWGTRALVDAPDAVLAVHRSYLEAGCDVISTDTWGLAGVAADLHWMDLGRRGIQLAREAVGDRGAAGCRAAGRRRGGSRRRAGRRRR